MSDSTASVVPARDPWQTVLKDEPNMTGADELSLFRACPHHPDTRETRGRTSYKVSSSEEGYLGDQ